MLTREVAMTYLGRKSFKFEDETYGPMLFRNILNNYPDLLPDLMYLLLNNKRVLINIMSNNDDPSLSEESPKPQNNEDSSLFISDDSDIFWGSDSEVADSEKPDSQSMRELQGWMTDILCNKDLFDYIFPDWPAMEKILINLEGYDVINNNIINHLKNEISAGKIDAATFKLNESALDQIGNKTLRLSELDLHRIPRHRNIKHVDDFIRIFSSAKDSTLNQNLAHLLNDPLAFANIIPDRASLSKILTLNMSAELYSQFTKQTMKDMLRRKTCLKYLLKYIHLKNPVSPSSGQSLFRGDFPYISRNKTENIKTTIVADKLALRLKPSEKDHPITLNDSELEVLKNDAYLLEITHKFKEYFPELDQLHKANAIRKP